MASASDKRLDNGPGDGSLRNALDVAIQADLSALFTLEQNRVTGVGTIQPGTTSGKVKTTTETQYLLANSGYQKATTDDLWDLTGITTASGKAAKVLLQLDSSGTATVKKGTEAATQAAATFPAPDASVTVVGWVQLGASYAGGALTQAMLFDGTPLTPTLQTTA